MEWLSELIDVLLDDLRQAELAQDTEKAARLLRLLDRVYRLRLGLWAIGGSHDRR